MDNTFASSLPLAPGGLENGHVAMVTRSQRRIALHNAAIALYNITIVCTTTTMALCESKASLPAKLLADEWVLKLSLPCKPEDTEDWNRLRQTSHHPLEVQFMGIVEEQLEGAVFNHHVLLLEFIGEVEHTPGEIIRSGAVRQDRYFFYNDREFSYDVTKILSPRQLKAAKMQLSAKGLPRLLDKRCTDFGDQCRPRISLAQLLDKIVTLHNANPQFNHVVLEKQGAMNCRQFATTLYNSIETFLHWEQQPRPQVKLPFASSSSYGQGPGSYIGAACYPSRDSSYSGAYTPGPGSSTSTSFSVPYTKPLAPAFSPDAYGGTSGSSTPRPSSSLQVSTALPSPSLPSQKKLLGFAANSSQYAGEAVVAASVPLVCANPPVGAAVFAGGIVLYGSGLAAEHYVEKR